jgi:hypothetical protein
MVCPECHGSFQQALQCPTCGVRLHYQASGPASVHGLGPQDGLWQHQPIGRILVGILLAQGLAYGLQLLCTAGLLATSEDPSRATWETIFGLVLLQVIQAFSLLIGGGLAGAGQRRGLLLGTIVGLVSGPLFLVLQQLQGESLTEVAVVGQPVLAVVFGGLGGLVGGLVWKPLPPLPLPRLRKDGTKTRARRKSSLDGPVAWGRVLLGVVLGSCAIFWPQVILDFVLDASRGKLRVQTALQAQLVTWEIGGLLLVVAGALAGATTRNGLKHGLFVGVGVAVIVVGHYLAAPDATLETTVLMLSCVLGLTVVGGWFGGQLFPPIFVRQRIRTFA